MPLCFLRPADASGRARCRWVQHGPLRQLPLVLATLVPGRQQPTRVGELGFSHELRPYLARHVSNNSVGLVSDCQVALRIRDNDLADFLSPSHARGAVSAQRAYLLSQLKSVLDAGVPGAILELGCHSGRQTTVWLRRVLDRYGNRTLHVYDSFEGLPQKTDPDRTTNFTGDAAGSMRVSASDVARTFQLARLRAPDAVHKGFFGSLPDDEYPSPIAFAFFDGDLFSSIYQSFEKVWAKLSEGGVVVVHDFLPTVGSRFPGAKAATEAFLRSLGQQAVRGVDECYDIMGKVRKRPKQQIR